jgi:hypothetical protein
MRGLLRRRSFLVWAGGSVDPAAIFSGLAAGRAIMYEGRNSLHADQTDQDLPLK